MSRIQLALNVDDLDTSIAFYSLLFGVGPAKTKPGYANFAVAEPPLKLILIENPGEGGSINHLGVEVSDTETVDAEQTRLAAAGFASIDDRRRLLRRRGLRGARPAAQRHGLLLSQSAGRCVSRTRKPFALARRPVG